MPRNSDIDRRASVLPPGIFAASAELKRLEGAMAPPAAPYLARLAVLRNQGEALLREVAQADVGSADIATVLPDV